MRLRMGASAFAKTSYCLERPTGAMSIFFFIFEK